MHAFLDAAKAVKEGRFDEARAIELLPSDRILIERRIAEESSKRKDTEQMVGGDRKASDAGSSPAPSSR